MTKRRNRRRQQDQKPAKPKVAPENTNRLQKSQVGAEETAEENLKELGKQAQVKSPAELSDLVRRAAADGVYSQTDSANTDLQLAGLIAVTQESLVQEVGFTAGKAKEARVYAEEHFKKLEAAGLLPRGDMWEQLKRGSFFLGNGRRVPVAELIGALALVKSAVLVPRRPGDTPLKERLFAEVAPMLIPQVMTQLSFQVGQWNIIEVDGTASYGEIACVTKYDEDTMSHLVFYAVDKDVTTIDATAFKGSSAMPAATLAPASFFSPGGPSQTSVKCKKITDLFPNIKSGDRIPLNWIDNGTSAGYDLATGMLVPFPTGCPVIALKIDEAAHAFDTAAAIRVAAALGLTHLVNHPLAQAAGLMQGTLEGVLSMSGTMDLSTKTRD